MSCAPRTFKRRKKNAPCYGCSDRVLNCHSTCEKYKKFVCENKAEKTAVINAYAAEHRAESYEIKEKRKNKEKKSHKIPWHRVGG